MQSVIFTALGVGGATIVGAVIGFLFQEFSQKFSGLVLAFAAGVMLLAAVQGLILPSLEQGGVWALPVTLLGIFAGGACLALIDRATPDFSKAHAPALAGAPSEQYSAVMLFVTAIAIHNLPEGIAAGVGFGTGDTAAALVIAGGIALQNLPEGMVLIAPMLSAGVRPGKTLAIAAGTGVIEIVGTFIGYFAVHVATGLLPFALAFAGGTMLFVICREMIPATCTGHGACFSLLAGFSLMLVANFFL